MADDYKKFSISTSSRTQFLDITHEVQDIVSKSGVLEGACIVFIPHTTAGVTINENADPDVVRDMKMYLDEAIPWDHTGYRHSEGNSAAHIKSSLTGSSLNVIINSGRLQLGTWQGIYFAEYDGPRQRNVWVKVIKS